MDILEKEKELQALEKQLDKITDKEARQSILKEIETYKSKMMQQLDAWDRVLLARHQARPTCQEYIDAICDEFIELHGDRNYQDDHAMIGGIGRINGFPVTIIGNKKGKCTDDNIVCNFGMSHPEGYRKAYRLMKQAEKFHRPIITFIDTPGAYPGLGAESRGQGEAIAKNLFMMSDLEVPIIAVVIGEGGSGGALAIGMGNKVFMLENSIYSILSPEGYASILWKDAKRAKEAATAMKLTSYDLLELDIIDDIIKEPLGGAHRNKEQVFTTLKEKLYQTLLYYQTRSHYEIKTERYTKYRKIGFFQRFNYEHLQGVVK